MLEYIPCNLCKQDDSQILHMIDSFRIVKCRNCGLVYVNPRLNSSKIKEMYTESYFASRQPLQWGYDDYLSMRGPLTEMFSHHLKLIERFRKGRRILDVGCATGFFLEIAENNNWDAYGVEVSEYASHYAREELGLNVFTGTVKGASFPDEFFDVVTMWDVLEHLADPASDLMETNRILKRDGLIFVTAPNISSLAARLTGKKWFGFTKVREHTFYFCPSTLTKMLQKAGFEVLKIETSPLRCSLKFLVGKLEPYSKVAHRTLECVVDKTGLSDRSINFRLIDILAIARKS